MLYMLKLFLGTTVVKLPVALPPQNLTRAHSTETGSFLIDHCDSKKSKNLVLLNHFSS